MMLTWWQVLAGYTGLFLALAAGMVWLRWKRRRERKPFPDRQRLLRGPGETLWRRMEKIDQELLHRAALAFVLPPVASVGLGWAATRGEGVVRWVVVGGVLAGLAGAFWWMGRGFAARLEEWRNRYLGWFGERVVAEALEGLKAIGYLVFHDVPQGKGGGNIDHVVVGPKGVFALETKTRRQGSVKPGRAADRIVFDGDKLCYPWGEDRFGLEAAGGNARALEQWLTEGGGEARGLKVKALLVFPGWNVLETRQGEVAVVAPAQVMERIEAGAGRVLTPETVASLGRRLEALCRDVEF